ncbi:MAG: 30S ribosomal protein S13 [archaeon]
MAEKNIKPMIRLFSADVPGKTKVYIAIRKIKGISFSLSNAICLMLNLDKNEPVGAIDDSTIKKIENAAKDPASINIPLWMLNRQKDYDTGEDVHLIESDLKLRKEFDIKRLKKIKAYRGVRHMFGLPTRGQKTKSNFRKNKGKATGVQKKSKK